MSETVKVCVCARFGGFVAISRVEYNAVCRDWIASTGILCCVGKAKVLDTVLRCKYR